MKIVLQKINLVDADKIAAWKSDPQLSKDILSSFNVVSIKEAREWITQNSEDKNQRLNGIYYSGPDQNELVGITRLMFIDREAGVSELGIYIGNRKYHGQGLGTKALTLTIEQGFNELKLNKIFLKVGANNASAIQLYKKFNFKVEGILKDHVYRNNQYSDLIYMALFNQKKPDN